MQSPHLLRRSRSLSIRTSLLAVVALLAGIACCNLGWTAYADWRALARAEERQEADAGANRFIAGLFEVLMERLATNNALQAQGPADAATLAEIATRRAAMQASFLAGRAVLAARDFPGRAELMTALDAALARANEARRQADAAIRQPRDARDAVLRQNFIPNLTASVNAALEVWFSASTALAADDPVLTRLTVIKQLGWRMRDTAGLERSSIASAITAGQPVAAERLAANAGIRAAVDSLWLTFNNLAPAADPATPQVLRAAAAMAEREYFSGFRPLVDQQVQAGAAAPGGRYPITVADFVATTTAQLGTLLEVMHAAGRASEAHGTGVVATERAALGLALALLGVALLAALLAGWLVIQRVARPLARLEAATTRLAAGEYDVAVPGADSGDEVGRLGRAILVLQQGLAEREALRATQESDRYQAAAQTRAAVQRMAEQIEAAATTASSAISQTNASLVTEAVSLAGATEMVATRAATVNQMAERVLADTGAGAAAAEELSVTIRDVATQIGAASSAVRRAVERTEASQSTIQGLSEAATRIGDVVRLIASIASQTNLLALNATIEAARAGDAGKGFAVVASEVKALAGQTARATEEIGRQVADIGDATGRAVAAVAEIAAAIQDTDAATATIADAMEQQGQATAEIARTVAGTTASARGVSTEIAEVSSVLAEAGNRATAIRGAAAQAEAAAVALRTELVRIVRTSTPEADRRDATRLPGQGRAMLQLGSDQWHTSLVNLSWGGAALAPPAGVALPRAGQAGWLRMDGGSVGWPCTVLDATAELVRLRFEKFGQPEREALDRALREAEGRAAEASGQRAAA